MILKNNGYSLIELLGVLAIIGVLSAISYPAYQQHIMKATRAQAITALYTTATKLEQYYSTHGSYQGATLATLGITTTQNHYHLHLQISINDGHYELSATPIGRQQKDYECGTLNLEDTGKKWMTGTGNQQQCWGS